MRYFLFIIVFLLSFFLISCEEEIPWNTKEVEEVLVVEGAFTSEFKHHKIVLRKTADYFSAHGTPAVTGAEVNISAKNDTIEFIEVPDSPGVYKTKHPTGGWIDTEYKLNIHLQEPIRGETYYYASEEMIDGISINNFSASIYENPFYMEGANMNGDSLVLVASLFGNEPKDIHNYYMVKLQEYSENKEDTITNIDIFSDDEVFEGEEENNLYFYENYKPGDTIEIEISTVSKQYSNFVDGVKKLATQEQDQFFDMSGPPANAEGNIKGAAEALGYFRVSKVTRAKSVAYDHRDDKRDADFEKN